MNNFSKTSFALITAFTFLTATVTGCGSSTSDQASEQSAEPIVGVDDAGVLVALGVVVGAAVLVTVVGTLVAQAYRVNGNEAQAFAVEDGLKKYVNEPIENGVNWLIGGMRNLALAMGVAESVVFLQIYQQATASLAASHPNVELPLVFERQNLEKAQALSLAALAVVSGDSQATSVSAAISQSGTVEALDTNVRAQLRALGGTWSHAVNAYMDAYIKVDQWLSVHNNMAAQVASLQYSHPQDLQYKLDVAVAFDPVIRQFQNATGCKVLSNFSYGNSQDAGGYAVASLPTVCGLGGALSSFVTGEVMAFVGQTETLIWAHGFGMEGDRLTQRAFVSANDEDFVEISAVPATASNAIVDMATCGAAPIVELDTQTSKSRPKREPITWPFADRCSVVKGLVESTTILAWTQIAAQGLAVLGQSLPGMVEQIVQRLRAEGLNAVLGAFGQSARPVPCINISLEPVKRFLTFTAGTGLFLVVLELVGGQAKNTDFCK